MTGAGGAWRKAVCCCWRSSRKRISISLVCCWSDDHCCWSDDHCCWSDDHCCWSDDHCCWSDDHCCSVRCVISDHPRYRQYTARLSIGDCKMASIDCWTLAREVIWSQFYMMASSTALPFPSWDDDDFFCVLGPVSSGWVWLDLMGRIRDISSISVSSRLRSLCRGWSSHTPPLAITLLKQISPPCLCLWVARL